MIHYDLLCAENHRFDGWFRDSAAFETQAAGGLLECPFCGDLEISRALMTPAVKRGRAPPMVRQDEVSVPTNPAAPVTRDAPLPATAGANMPAQVRAMLQRIRSEVERRCDYVGETFADEARRIHRGEVEAHGIYGETTPEQAEELRDEGIEVASIPWIPRAEG